MMNTTASGWRRPEILLMLMAIAVPFSFSAWQTLLNNFAIEQAAFTGREMGILQSLREIPGFLAFAVVFLLLIIKEQRLAYISLLLSLLVPNAPKEGRETWMLEREVEPA